MALTNYGILASIFYFFTIQQITYCYSDGLGNSSLKLLPAIIGSDIELRCTKVLEQQSGDVIMVAACTDVTKAGCGHIWSKNGTMLNASTTDVDKYEFSNMTTVGYCSIFRDTTSTFNTFGFSNGSYGFKCLAASMKIKNVSVDDFGVYTCNFSNHYEEVWTTPTIDQTEVIQAGTKYQVKEVAYLGGAYQNSYDQMLLQCVVTGGNVKWFLKPRELDYEKYCNFTDCPEDYISLDKINTADYWRCYNLSVIYMSPYENVSESLIGIKNLCLDDNDVIICTVDGQVKDLSGKWEKRFYITERNDGWYYQRYYYITETTEFVVTMICVPVLLVVLFIAVVVTAMVRGKISFCCRDTTQYSLTLPLRQQGT